MLDNDTRVYGCSLAKLRQDIEQSREFQKFGPVIYTTILMDRAHNLIDEGSFTEAKQFISRAKWVMLQYVLGDDE